MPFIPPGQRLRKSSAYEDGMNELSQILLANQAQQQMAEQEPVMINYAPQDLGIPEEDEDITEFEPDPSTMPWTKEAQERLQMEFLGTTQSKMEQQQLADVYRNAVESQIITPEEAEGYQYLMNRYAKKVTTPQPAPVNQSSENPNVINGIDVDLALQAVGITESGAKPGQSKLGLPTSMEGSASGTFQLTDETKLDVYQNSYKDKYKTFDDFKQAFNTDPKLEYDAARSLMKRHIENYGEYALGAWYYPEYARRAKNGDQSVFDKVPRADYGNKLTWGQDFNKKRSEYYKLLENRNINQNMGVSNDVSNFTPKVKSDDVNYTNIDPRLKSWYSSISETYGQPVITSGNDSDKHVKGSKHYENKAIDIRSRDAVGMKLKNDVINKGQFIMNTRRGPVYAFNGVRVLIENDHLHVSI